MKKYSAFLVLGALIILVSACGGGTPPAPAAPAAPVTAPAEPAPAAEGVPELNFVLVNATGYGIKELYMSPASSGSWEQNMIPEGQIFANGSSSPIKFTGYNPDVALWDLKAVEDNGDPHEYRGLDLTEIEKLTLNAEDATINDGEDAAE